jgi:asparagine synthase (glutamine-hydrolysing)
MLADLQTYLPDNMLMRGDKVVMAASVEARTPLLDRDVVETIVRAPVGQRSHVFSPKRILRQAVSDLLPPEVRRARKRGFPVPLARFIVGDKSDLASRIVQSSRALDRGLFRPEAVERLVAEARGGAASAEFKVFTLLSLELWLRANVDAVMLAPDAAGFGDD